MSDARDADEYYRRLGPQPDTPKQLEERAAWYRGYGLALLGALGVVTAVCLAAFISTFI